jgi:hypothetical protein
MTSHRKNLDRNLSGATALLTATVEFLYQNKISKKFIVDFIRDYPNRKRGPLRTHVYHELEKAQEDIGIIVGTWFSNPRFLDAVGTPIPLTIKSGPHSFGGLIRASHTKTQTSVVLELMRESPSIRFTNDGHIFPLKRVFALPKLGLSRAAFVVERYLETVLLIGSEPKEQSPLPMERSCHVSQVDVSRVMPLLRDLESRGTAFIDLIDGELEGHRLKDTKRKEVCELGVHVFVWKKPANKISGPKRTKSAGQG